MSIRARAQARPARFVFVDVVRNALAELLLQGPQPRLGPLVGPPVVVQVPVLVGDGVPEPRLQQPEVRGVVGGLRHTLPGPDDQVMDVAGGGVSGRPRIDSRHRLAAEDRARPRS